jgi:hypothetical protein
MIIPAPYSVFAADTGHKAGLRPGVSVKLPFLAVGAIINIDFRLSHVNVATNQAQQ